MCNDRDDIPANDDAAQAAEPMACECDGPSDPSDASAPSLEGDVDEPQVVYVSDNHAADKPHSGMYEIPVEDADGETQFRAIPTPEQKAKGVVKMVGGTALAVVGVPMLVLPGPGVLAIAGGAAIASRGHRDLTGREATAVEENLDAAADKLGELAKGEMEKAAAAFDEKAPDGVKAAVSTVSSAASTVADAAGKAADAVSTHGPAVGKQVGDFASDLANKAKSQAPDAAKQVGDFAQKLGASASKAGKDALDALGKMKRQ